MTDLHRKYRPQRLEEVIGQDGVVESLESLFEQKRVPHSFLFTGPSGVGKTTLARIIASKLKVPGTNLLEIDAATHTGVGDMRHIKETISTPAFSKSRKRFVIIDECHSLSKQAWQSWLKIVEEPPKHLYLAFCTTEAAKVPKTIKTRCHSYDLQSASEEDLAELILRVNEEEELGFEEDIVDYVASAAGGSHRQALVMLSQVIGAEEVAEAKKILRQADQGSAEVIEFCRALFNPKWKALMKLVEKMDERPESVRIVVRNYMSKVAMGAKSETQLMKALLVLEVFGEPFNDSEGKAPLVTAIGRLCFD